MSYRVRFRDAQGNPQGLHDHVPSNLTDAQLLAVQLSGWNQRVDIIDAETNEVVQPYEPHSEAGARMLESAHAQYECMKCDKIWPRFNLLDCICPECGGTLTRR